MRIEVVLLAVLLSITLFCGCKDAGSDKSNIKNEKELSPVEFPGLGYFATAGLDIEIEKLILKDAMRLSAGNQYSNNPIPDDALIPVNAYIHSYYGTYNNGNVVALRYVKNLEVSVRTGVTWVTVNGLDFGFPTSWVIEIWVKGKYLFEHKNGDDIGSPYGRVYWAQPSSLANGFFCSLLFAHLNDWVTDDDVQSIYELFLDNEKSNPSGGR